MKESSLGHTDSVVGDRDDTKVRLHAQRPEADDADAQGDGHQGQTVHAIGTCLFLAHARLEFFVLPAHGCSIRKRCTHCDDRKLSLH